MLNSKNKKYDIAGRLSLSNASGHTSFILDELISEYDDRMSLQGSRKGSVKDSIKSSKSLKSSKSSLAHAEVSAPLAPPRPSLYKSIQEDLEQCVPDPEQMRNTQLVISPENENISLENEKSVEKLNLNNSISSRKPSVSSSDMAVYKNEKISESHVRKKIFLTNKDLLLIQSVSTISEGAENYGQINFSIKFDFENGNRLIFNMIDCIELPAYPITSHPYIKGKL